MFLILSFNYLCLCDVINTIVTRHHIIYYLLLFFFFLCRLIWLEFFVFLNHIWVLRLANYFSFLSSDCFIFSGFLEFDFFSFCGYKWFLSCSHSLLESWNRLYHLLLISLILLIRRYRIFLSTIIGSICHPFLWYHRTYLAISLWRLLLICGQLLGYGASFLILVHSFFANRFLSALVFGSRWVANVAMEIICILS